MTEFESQLYQYFSQPASCWQIDPANPANACSTAHGIIDALKCIYSEKIFIVSPEISNGKSPASKNETSGVIRCVRGIVNSLASDDYLLKRPIVAFWETKVSKKVEESSEEISLWQIMVIIPKIHTLINGNVVTKGSETIYFVDSSGLNLKMPKLMKYLLKRKISIKCGESKISKFGGPFPEAVFEEKSLKFHDHPSESGLWSIFNIIMIISNGCTNFFETFREFDPINSLKLKAILDLYNIVLDKTPENRFPELTYDLRQIEIISNEIFDALYDDVSGWELLEKEMRSISKYFFDIRQLCILWEYKQNDEWGEAKMLVREIERQNIIMQDESKLNTCKPILKDRTPPTHQSAIKVKAGKSFLVNYSVFERAVKNFEKFVDKSLLIKEILTENVPAILITQPQKWGKTFNMNMLKTFLHPTNDASGNFKNLYLFTGGNDNSKCLKIMTEDNGLYREIAGTIPTIFLSFSTISYNKSNKSSEEYYRTEISVLVKNAYSEHIKLYSNALKKAIESYFSSHPDKRIDYENSELSALESIIDTNKIRLKSYINSFRYYINDSPSILFRDAVPNLAKFLHKLYKKTVFIILDGYDTPIVQAINRPDQNITLHIINEFLIEICKTDSKDIERVVMTGTLPISKSILPWMKNVQTYTIKDKKYTKYFGFTEAEVNTLITEVLENESDKEWYEQKELIKLRYNGYNIAGQKIYNPYSIMKCLNNKRTPASKPPKPYCMFGEETDLLIKSFNALESYEELSELIRTCYLELSRKIQSQLDLTKSINSKDNFFSALLHAGCLTPYSFSEDEIKKIIYHSHIYVVPNREIKKYFYHELLSTWIKNKITPKDIEIGKIVKDFHTSLDNNTEFYNLIQLRVLDEMTDNTSKTEADFQILLGGIAMLASLKRKSANYILHSEAPTKLKTRIDGIFIPVATKKETVIIHEYKKLEDADIGSAHAKAEDALWQIYVKQYMKIAFDLFDSDTHYKHFKNIIIRGIVFYQVRNGEKWNMFIKEHSIDFDVARKRNEFFTSAKARALAEASILCGESGSANDKKLAREALGFISIDELVTDIDKNFSPMIIEKASSLPEKSKLCGEGYKEAVKQLPRAALNIDANLNRIYIESSIYKRKIEYVPTINPKKPKLVNSKKE